ncbi:solute carrier organic anion transporter family member 5A1, partial [Brachionus plicatilis]
FEFSSMSSGILSGFLEIGSLITTLIMSYFFSNSHIPKCVAISSVICALASFMYSLPHFLTHPYSPILFSNNSNEKLLCSPNGTANFLENKIKAENLEKNSYPLDSILDKLDIKSHCLLKPSNLGAFLIFACANLLIGSTSAPLYTLGTSYIDSHVHKDNSSVYLAFIYSMLAFGPLVGYLVGAGFLQINSEHFKTHSGETDLNDSSWTGAWHLGFILFGVLILLTAIVFFLFPKEMKNQNKTNEQESCTSNASYGDLKNLPKAILNLVSNRVFMVVTFALCFEITIISGFMTFLPKYLEHQFSLNNSVANIYTGGIAIPGAIVGIVTGGFLVKKFNINPNGASVLAICCNILCLCGILVLIFIGCPNIKMAGTTASYSSNKYTLLESKKIEIEKFNLSSECNRECSCSTSFIEPVCGRNQITYSSPCYAGCTKFDSHNKKVFYTCKCVRDDQNDNSIPDAISGSCTYDCRMLFPFLGVLFFITFLTSLNQMPTLMVTLRSVSEVETPFALGLQLVIMRLLGD